MLSFLPENINPGAPDRTRRIVKKIKVIVSDNFEISKRVSCCKRNKGYGYGIGYKVSTVATVLVLFLMLTAWGVEGKERSSGRDGGKGSKLQDMMMMDSNSNFPSLFEWKSEMGMSSARIIPNQHHVSAFLNGGVSSRFLYMNERPGNVLSILVTPCTSILLWSVKFWPLGDGRGNGSRQLDEPQILKSFRTDRSGTFYDLKSRLGIYSVEIKALQSDSYVHLYASNSPEPLRIPSNFIEMSDMSATAGIPKPRISVRRLRGNRLHVKWEPSPRNPHLMKYCIVVNSYRDYSSLCGAQGVKYGVLPPDLMHVSYYYFPLESKHKSHLQQQQQQYPNKMRDSERAEGSVSGSRGDFFPRSSSSSSKGNNNSPSPNDNNFMNVQLMMNDPSNSNSNDYNSNHHHHQHHHLPDQRRPHNPLPYSKRQRQSSFEERERAKDLIIGCVNKKTNYILNNLREGKLYYFNVFIKDTSTNLTYPYVRTTMKYIIPKNLPNGISDSKATKVTIPSGKHTLMKFNLKKPCTELSLYVMSCGGGSITYQLIHAYKSIIESQPVDSLDIVKIAMPLRGRYYIRLRQSPSPTHNNFNSSASSASSSLPIMAEIYVSKKNKRFPLPKLPYNTQVIELHSERACDSVKILWHPSPEPRDNEYCIFLKEESRKRIFNFKKPNQCDVERSLNNDPYVTHSLCLQRTPSTQGGYLSQTIGGLHPGKTYISQLILRRHKGKALSYDLFQVSTLSECPEG